ncbi:hypothetical protein Ocin01_19023 [Orchesella cincta]|uniref:Uncharacterized protein n=1 Tax=Orchesella cincta TaxID=48709 RepID=A0A1D2M3X1_ORCCI|nr:hypothetical protein Ocin01_19023 [Orchesella cincta]
MSLIAPRVKLLRFHERGVEMWWNNEYLQNIFCFNCTHPHGTRSARRHQPVNISDRNCPALGCTGNLTSDTFNGKGSIAATILPTASSTSSKDERFDSPEFLQHHHPLKIEIKSITNSTIANSLDSSYVHVDEETGRSDDEFPVSAFFSWAVYWLFKIKSSIADDYIEYYVKLGQDSKHPFSSYGGGWLLFRVLFSIRLGDDGAEIPVSQTFHLCCEVEDAVGSIVAAIEPFPLNVSDVRFPVHPKAGQFLSEMLTGW